MGSAAGPLQVLFCDTAFSSGARFTAEELDRDAGIEVVSCMKADLARCLPSADVAVPLGAKLTGDLIRATSRLKLIIQYGVGLEGIDIPAATEKGIWVSNIPSDASGNAASCAEMAVYLALAMLRDQRAMVASLRDRRLGEPLGQTLLGKTALLVGFGNIAAELVPRLKPFGMRMIGVRRSEWGEPPTAPAQLLDQRAQWRQLQRWLPEADIINDETRGMVNGQFLSHCKHGVRLVNVARGGLLEYEAVKEGLQSGVIGGMGLDVQWQEPYDPDDFIAQHSKVVLTPHVAGVTELSYRSMAVDLATAVRRAQQGEPPIRKMNQVSN